MWGTVRSPGNKLITNLPYNYLLDKLYAGVRQGINALLHLNKNLST